MIETVGVDVGGTKVAAAALRDGQLGEPQLRPTDTDSAEELIDELVAAIDSVRGDGTEAIGLGVPSVVNFEAGRLRSSVNVPFKDLPLREMLSERLGLPVVIDNDATVAALAEAWDGERIAVENLVMFTVGTGVGGGLVLGGRVYRGSTGAAAEVGHGLIGLPIEAGVPMPTGFPQPGSLEALAAGTALDKLGRRIAEDQPDSPLGRKAADGETVDGRDVVEAANSGDGFAAGAIRVLGQRLGVGIANVINLLDPDVVAIGGGVSAAGDLLLEPARETALGYLLPGVGTETEIRIAHRGPEAGVLGAAVLAAIEPPPD